MSIGFVGLRGRASSAALTQAPANGRTAAAEAHRFARRRRVTASSSRRCEEEDRTDDEEEDEKREESAWATDINYVTSTPWERERDVALGPLAVLTADEIIKLSQVPQYWDLDRVLSSQHGCRTGESLDVSHAVVYLNDLPEDATHKHVIYRIDETAFCFALVINKADDKVEQHYYFWSPRDGQQD